MLLLIGLIGLWSLMYRTTTDCIGGCSHLAGDRFPVGIHDLEQRDRANNIVRPILDTMQTMPVFVYLIPAVLFSASVRLRP